MLRLLIYQAKRRTSQSVRKYSHCLLYVNQHNMLSCHVSCSHFSTG